MVGKKDLAITQYKEALRLKPDYQRAHFSLAVEYSMGGQHDLAISEYQEAIRLRPDDAMAHFNLSYVYDQKGLYDLAIEECEEALRLRPNWIEALEVLDELAIKHKMMGN